MKYLTITLATYLMLSISACKNIEKMVDKGEYDEAITYAVSKLEGQKNKKTKYVKALERAYSKVNNRDEIMLKSLSSSNNINKYDKIYDLYKLMSYRQSTVLRLDPLISEDGYVAGFELVDYNTLIAKAAERAASTHYNEVLRLLEIAKTTDKYAARLAYTTLGYIERYDDRYKNTDDLYRQAYDLGTDHVGIELYQNGFDHTSGRLSDIIHGLNIQSLNSFWTQYHIGNENKAMDFTATIEINNIEAGYERESFNTYTETKKLENGTKPVLDMKGNEVKDTLGQTIMTKKYKTVSAEITEMNREKAARIIGKTVIYNNNSKSLVKSVPIEITHIFEDYSTKYRGDKRALSSATKKKLKERCDIFPSDYEMVMAMAHNFKNSVYDILSRDVR